MIQCPLCSVYFMFYAWAENWIHVSNLTQRIKTDGHFDLVCQVFYFLPSVVQHVPHTKDGTEGVVFRVVVTALDLLPRHRGREVPPKQNRTETSFLCFVHKWFNNTYTCARLCGLPGDIEEWKTNAVFDEDGEIVHIQHRLAGKGNQEKGAERWRMSQHTQEYLCVRVVFVRLCVSLIHCTFLLGWTPSLNLAITPCVVRGLQANSRYCPWVEEDRSNVGMKCRISKIVPQMKEKIHSNLTVTVGHIISELFK